MPWVDANHLLGAKPIVKGYIQPEGFPTTGVRGPCKPGIIGAQ
jgi:hypothetical protein